MGERGDVLASRSFWDQWWKDAVPPLLPDPAKSFDACFIDVFRRRLALGPEHHLLEVGCAPGKWMAHFHKAFGCAVHGCDWSTEGLAAARRNLDALGVKGALYQGDFLSMELPRTFDAVLSLGFIEHFSDPLSVARRHAACLSPGGVLALEVPNFRGVNRWLQSPALLSVHNLSTMTRAFFRSVAEECGLVPRWIGYLGGFEPANISYEGKGFAARAAGAALARVRRLPGAGVNAPWWSGFLMGFFEKPPSRGIFRP